MTLRIRKAGVNDANIITTLARITQLETFEKLNKPGQTLAYINECLSFKNIENELLDQNSWYFIAEIFEKAIGFLKLRTDNFEENKLAGENAIELQRIYLLATEKGKGFGKQLLHFAENLAKDSGYKILWLGVWELNLGAQDFYRKEGYKKFGSHAFLYDGEIQNDYMLRKELN